MIGKSILENNLRNLEHLFLSELIRDNYTISPRKPFRNTSKQNEYLVLVEM